MTCMMANLVPLCAAATNLDFGNLLQTYAVTIGWAITGGIGMGLGLILALKIFTFMTKDVNEWELIKQNNIPVAIVLGSVVLGTSLVIAMCAKP